jgi:glycosyltransferase involved in cell wall biosynthesis
MLDPELEILVHSPHNSYSKTHGCVEDSAYYKVFRFHYFWPFHLELLSGRGIMPALRSRPLLYGQIPFLILFQFLSLWRLARRVRPDLLYAHWFTPQAVTTALVARLTKIPFVFTTHASDVSVLARIPIASKLVQWVCLHAVAYTAVSERTAGKLEGFFSQQAWLSQYSRKLKIIPMGVEIPTSAPDQVVMDEVRRKYALDDRPIVLFLGRLAEKKGVSYLLDAVSLLPEKMRNSFQLVVAGDGQLRSVLMEKSNLLGLKTVTFTGHVHGQEKDSLFALADCLCIPSIIDDSGDSEGFPVVLMEGLAAGKLIVASNVSGAETLYEAQDRGFIFSEKSPAELAECLSRVLALKKSDADEYRKRNRDLSRRFSWSHITKQYHELLTSAAKHAV